MSPRRLVQLHAGLGLYGLSIALLVRAGLGLDSWDVLHQGLARRIGLPLGWVINAVAVLVLLAWIPLRQKPGYGTLANVVLVGLTAQAGLAVIPNVHPTVLRWAILAIAILANAAATALYVGAGFGPGPRDGLMTGLAARGLPIGLVRTVIEISVLSVGWLLGGAVGPGTVLYAVTIGPLIHRLLPHFTLDKGDRHAPPQHHHGQHPTTARRRPGRRLVHSSRT